MNNQPITDEQLANLIKLAEYLESGNLRAEFDMSDFANPLVDGPTCGTVGCAIGHLPYATGNYRNFLTFTAFSGVGPYEDWIQFSKRVIGIDDVNLSGAYRWLFNGNWSVIDNSPKGAAIRIRYWINNNFQVPEWFDLMYYDPVWLSKYQDLIKEGGASSQKIQDSASHY